MPLIVLAGKEYGSGSSRDWAAKGTNMLGIKAVIAESFERIHRSNLIGMGILPLQFADGESAQTHGLTGREELSIRGLSARLSPGSEVVVQLRRDDGNEFMFSAISRIDSPADAECFRQGGILQMVLRHMLASRS